GDGSQTRSVCYVDDTVAGILALAASEFAGPVNIGGSEELTVLRLAETIRELTGSASPVEFIPRPVDDPAVRRPDTSLAQRRLGWRLAITLEEGLQRTIGWFTTIQSDSLRPGQEEYQRPADGGIQRGPGTEAHSTAGHEEV